MNSIITYLLLRRGRVSERGRVTCLRINSSE